MRTELSKQHSAGKHGRRFKLGIKRLLLFLGEWFLLCFVSAVIYFHSQIISVYHNAY